MMTLLSPKCDHRCSTHQAVPEKQKHSPHSDESGSHPFSDESRASELRAPSLISLSDRGRVVQFFLPLKIGCASTTSTIKNRVFVPEMIVSTWSFKLDHAHFPEKWMILRSLRVLQGDSKARLPLGEKAVRSAPSMWICRGIPIMVALGRPATSRLPPLT